MHELAITEHVVAAVVERIGDTPVRRVQLAIGKLSGVVPDALRLCFDICAADTSLAGARLDIIDVPGTAHCRDCAIDLELPDMLAVCSCGSANLQILGGEELRIIEVEVA